MVGALVTSYSFCAIMLTMAVERNQKSNELLHNEFVGARVEEYKKRRKAGLWSSSVLKNAGFIATVGGAMAVLASPAFTAGLAAGAVVKLLGEVAIKVGVPVMVFGAIKEFYNERKRP